MDYNDPLIAVRTAMRMHFRFPETFVVFCLLSMLASAQDAGSSKDLLELAAAERAFAAETVKVGFRDGFIKFFADDGIGFGPYPERTRETLLKSPAATGPRTVIFNWAPMFGDISLAGDLGYTTGPVLFTDVTEKPRPPWHGMYFSVWRKQPDGSWKVVIDLGVDVPQAIAPIDTPFVAARRKNALTKAGRADSSFTQLDAKLTTDIETKGILTGYQSHLNEEFRVHRNGHMPVLTTTELSKYFASNDSRVSYKFIGGKVAASNDLAFSYGSVHVVEKPGAIGHYVHVWRKNNSGKWRLVVDVLSELPKK